MKLIGAANLQSPVRDSWKISALVPHRRMGRGGEGDAAPPNFGQLRFFGQQEKIWARPVFKDVSMFFY